MQQWYNLRLWCPLNTIRPLSCTTTILTLPFFVLWRRENVWTVPNCPVFFASSSRCNIILNLQNSWDYNKVEYGKYTLKKTLISGCSAFLSFISDFSSFTCGDAGVQKTRVQFVWRWWRWSIRRPWLSHWNVSETFSQSRLRCSKCCG